MNRKQSIQERLSRGTIMNRDGQILSAYAPLRGIILEVLVTTWQKSSTLAGTLALLLLGIGALSLLSNALLTALIVLAVLILGYSVPSLLRAGVFWFQGEDAD